MIVRVVNVTQRLSPAGEFLDLGPDFKNFLLGAGRSWQGDVGEAIPQFMSAWAEKGKILIYDAKDGAPLLHGPGDITPGLLHPVTQLAGEDDLDEEEPDLESAVEARIPAQAGPGLSLGAHSPSTAQVHQPQPPHRARVSLGSTDEGGGDITPIPGETPRNIDDSDRFTVRAPRSHGPGAVISGAKR